MTEPPAKPRPAPGKRISFALAVFMHLVLAVLIIYGIRWQTQKPETVEVDLVRAAPPAPSPEPVPAPKVEPKPEPPPPPKVEPKPEPKPAPKPDIAQKEKEKPKPKPEPRPEPKPEPKLKPEPSKDPFKEQMEREFRDAEKRKAANAAAQEAAKELASLKAQQASAAKSSAMGDYIAKIRGKVRGNIVLPGDIKGNPEAVFEVTQLPSGEIITVKLRKSSGNPAWDNATERAILKSSPLPKPAQVDLFNRVLELTFRPLED